MKSGLPAATRPSTSTLPDKTPCSSGRTGPDRFLALILCLHFFRRKTIPENFELSGWAFSISGAEDLPTVLARSEMNLRDLEENVDYDFKMAAFLRFCFIN